MTFWSNEDKESVDPSWLGDTEGPCEEKEGYWPLRTALNISSFDYTAEPVADCGLCLDGAGLWHFCAFFI